MQTLLSLQDRSLGWGDHMVLPNLSISVSQGERIAVLGRSGVGKSTLLSALAAQQDGPRIALVPQDHGLVGSLSVFHNVWMGRLDDFGTARNLATLIWPRATQRAQVDAVLDRVGLTGLGRRPVAELSGGQRQRVALARALLRGGQIVLADEPVSAVDPAQGADLLRGIADRFETAIVVLHDAALARQFATRIIGLQAGGVAIDAAPDAISDADLAELYG
ncbi:phosphonate transport system ATP-binding protein [Monaibacterium marinum]|uniref:Phosphonate transport system ATP-binding protein n=1 Tax=Pontivivens marinum TaxID=1690039 RepID=A0A2C9CNW6_9RHOB|nr:ATP-binding cassette domain-containing protein [Monaibacterium marinum]SOH93221.1 phosphonate transport system ATP-binding protein [Monaibacterium marinum]